MPLEAEMGSGLYKGFRSKDAVHKAHMRLMDLKDRLDVLLAAPVTLEGTIELAEVRHQINIELDNIDKRRVNKLVVKPVEEEETFEEVLQLTEEEMAKQLDDILHFLESRADRSWKGGEIALELRALGVPWTLKGNTDNNTTSKTIAARLGVERKSPNSRITAVHAGKGKGFNYQWRQPVTQRAAVPTVEVLPRLALPPSPALKVEPAPVVTFQSVNDIMEHPAFKDLMEKVSALTQEGRNAHWGVMRKMEEQQGLLQEYLSESRDDLKVKIEILDQLKGHTQLLSRQQEALMGISTALQSLSMSKSDGAQSPEAIEHMKAQTEAIDDIRVSVGLIQQYVEKTNERVKAMYPIVTGKKP
jgi:hypothetical protein